MQENGGLCERMNYWDPAALNITAATQQGICQMAESLGLGEDEELSEDSGGEDDEEDPEDSAWVAENTVKDLPCTVGDTNNLTWVHPACHAIGGPSN